MSGRDRRHFVQQLRAAEQTHHAICARLKEAIRISEVHRIAVWAQSCEEWNIRQFLGGDASPSPSIVDAISAGFELLEVHCKRCGRREFVDLTLVIWPREKHVHTLAKVLRCQRCTREGSSLQANLVAMHRRPEPDAPPLAARKKRCSK